MTSYNNKFTPGNKSNLRKYLNNLIIIQTYNLNADIDGISGDALCGCIVEKPNVSNQGWNDSTQTRNKRISKYLTNKFGGKPVFSNTSKGAYDWSREGQPGGIQLPPRNKF